MKIDSSAVHVLDSHGVGAQAEFRISANAQSFRILSSGLYSDKISAVLREVGCNAADAHIAAGITDRPIEVKLPNRLDTEFYIKDWGTGLSHEDILGLYTTYFSSNKGGNNEQTGAFGLGSKSPFSYTDSFAVTTVKDGVQSSYTAHIGLNGSPVIAMLVSEAASPEWPNGIRVSFPVKPADLQEFETKAQLVFRWFAVKPLSPGETTSHYKAPEFKLSGSNFGFTTSAGPSQARRGYHYNPGSEPARVLTGNVAYPLDAERLGSDLAIVTQLIAAGVHLRMPLGSVMPTASREDLEYDERTRANLIKALKGVGKELALMLCAKVHELAVSEWERHNRARQFLEVLPYQIGAKLPEILGSLDIDDSEKKLVQAYYDAKSKVLPSWVGGAAPVVVTDSVVGLDQANSYRVWLVEKDSSRAARQFRRYAVAHGKIHRAKFAEDATIDYAHSVEIVYADAKHAYQRVQELLTRGRDMVVLVESVYELGKPGLIAHARKIAEEIGGLQAQGASSLPFSKQPPMPARKKLKAIKPAEKVRMYGMERIRFVSGDPGSMEEEMTPFKDIPETAYYYLPAPIERDPLAYGVTLPSRQQRTVEEKGISALVSAFQALRAQGIPVREITGYVYPAGPQARKFKLKEKGWQSLLDAIVEDLAKPEVMAAIGVRLNGRPYLSLDSLKTYRAYADRAGFLGKLAEAAATNTELKQWLFGLLPELPALAEIFNPLWEANVLTGCNTTTDMALQIFLNANLVNEEFEAQRMSADTFQKTVVKRYPETRFIQDDNFLNLWIEDQVGAGALLRLVFASIR